MSRIESHLLFAVTLASLVGCARSDMSDVDAGHDTDASRDVDSGGSSFDAGAADLGVDAPTVDPDLGVEDMGPGIDAGFFVDLGPRDDAGDTDAGDTDAGATDAGATDAGVPDAGATDAGRPDAGPADLGTDLGTDAGRPDLGAPDLGTDAGPADAGAPPDFGGVCPFGWDDTVDATIDVTVDDEYDLYVNGTLIGSDSNWYSTETYAVTLYRSPGRPNVIALRGHNGGSVGGRDRGVLLDLVATVDGTSDLLVSDTSWRTGAGDPGWSDVAFDDSSWGYAVNQGDNGIGPWGMRPSLDATAGWIWYFDSNTSTSGKPDVEDAYYRRTFWLDTSGALSDTPTICP